VKYDMSSFRGSGIIGWLFGRFAHVVLSYVVYSPLILT
jgi:hypothetical protein